MATILCTGVQRALMQTRKLILEQAGHTVVAAQTDDEIIAACREFKFDVVVIGQIGEPKWKRHWSALARKHCASVKVIEIYMPDSGIAVNDADDWLASPAMPTELAGRVRKLAAPIPAEALYDRLREICARVVAAHGAEFEIACRELADTLELWEKVMQERAQQDRKRQLE